MVTFNTTLLREKFSIIDPVKDPDGENPVVALSNRMVVALSSKNGKYKEEFVVRAQNMPLCIRMAGRIHQAFTQGGPISGRTNGYDWAAAYEGISNEFERTHNPDRWLTVYFKGKPVFSSGDHHALLDVVEKCNIDNPDVYDESVGMAEDVFKRAGKVVNIEHDANVALVVDFEDNSGKIGVILRGSDRTTTFSFTVTGDDKIPMSIPQCLNAAAAFLEGIQMTFPIGLDNYKIEHGVIKKFSKAYKKNEDSKKRMARLSAEIVNLETAYEVRYRPERPSLKELIDDAERLAVKIVDTSQREDDDEEEEEAGDPLASLLGGMSGNDDE